MCAISHNFSGDGSHLWRILDLHPNTIEADEQNYRKSGGTSLNLPLNIESSDRVVLLVVIVGLLRHHASHGASNRCAECRRRRSTMSKRTSSDAIFSASCSPMCRCRVFVLLAPSTSSPDIIKNLIPGQGKCTVDVSTLLETDILLRAIAMSRRGRQLSDCCTFVGLPQTALRFNMIWIQLYHLPQYR